MSCGYGLLRSIVDNNIPFSVLAEHGITADFFKPGDETAAYQFMSEYAQNVGGTPTFSTVTRYLRNPSCLNMEQEPVDFWIPQIVDRYRSDLMEKELPAIKLKLDTDQLDAAVSGLGDLYLGLRELSGSSIMDCITLMQKALEHHNKIQKHEISPGIPYGVPYLDEVSGGMAGGDLIVIVGETGVGKTELSLFFARNAYLQQNSVLFLSTEVGLLSLGRRLLALDFKENSNDLRLGRLSSFRSAYLASILEAKANNESDNFFDFVPGGVYASIGDIMMVAKEKRPDLLVIDGAYLLRLSTSKWKITARWDALTNIIHELKNFSLLENIPVLTTFQFNKKDSGSLEGIGGTAEIRRTASVVLSLEFERKEDALTPTEARYRILKFLKGREGEGGSIRLLLDFIETEILQDRVVSGGVLQQILGNERDIPEDVDDELITEI